MPGIKLHEPAFHYVSRAVVTGNTDIFPFRADSIYHQIEDFLQDLPVIGVLLLQEIDLQDFSEIAFIGPAFRHTSVTYKLKLNGGDIKAVQGDSGHSQVNMVTDVYSHILDEDSRLGK